ncbi:MULTISPECIES: maltokinase N-terminal cap-like domain-containing protein [Streptomyces]|uniref:1,4-alpha-glucan branching protein n=1 Tax=Streptomyces solicathayae TaxID=3081768 RepID=A0ABZ0LX11_9ACTN|nr:1,4-alpha-glucan branching protein [Streptomyces sp. HUAS YS2]WOX24003.1 1,4-alpha-glucan branching protein [Streptomyces sp. HUAS YS2]
MAIIHHTTMNPTKLELLAQWLPTRPWYEATGRTPEPVKAGGFRLEDPEGEVGIEFMVVTDASATEPVAYLVPLTYRAAPLDGAGADALIGTSEHGVLGTRWIYDGVHDPVLAAQLLALLRDQAEPQAQSVSDTPDPTVLRAGAALADGATFADVTVNRRLAASPAPVAAAHVTATWRLPDGTETRSVFVAAS